MTFTFVPLVQVKKCQIVHFVHISKLCNEVSPVSKYFSNLFKLLKSNLSGYYNFKSNIKSRDSRNFTHSINIKQKVAGRQKYKIKEILYGDSYF